MTSDLRRLVALLVLAATAGAFTPALAQVPPWVSDGPGVYKEENGVWRKVSWRDHAAAIDRMLERCCEEWRVPFTLPAGTTIVTGEDDKDLTRERTRSPDAGKYSRGPRGEEPVEGSTESHCGIDVGARVSTDGGTTIATLGSASVSPVHTGGYMRVQQGEIYQRIKCEHEGVRIVLEISYGHVTPGPGLGRDWVPTPDRPIGTLEGNDDWNSRDPRLPKKGNHIHVEVEGLYDKTFYSEMAHNQQLDGQAIPDDMAELLRRRAAFFNECLLRRLTGR